MNLLFWVSLGIWGGAVGIRNSILRYLSTRMGPHCKWGKLREVYFEGFEVRFHLL